MDIRRRRTRSATSCMTVDFSPLNQRTVLKNAEPPGSYYRLRIWLGAITLPLKTVACALTDTLDEGKRSYEHVQGESRAFSPLRRVAMWHRKTNDPNSENGVSTSDLPFFRWSAPGFAAFYAALKSRGYIETGSTYYKIIVDEGKTLDELYLLAQIEEKQIDEAVRPFSPSAELIRRFCTVGWVNSLHTVPVPDALPKVTARPLEETDIHISEARYRAWESLQFGGGTLSDFDKIQSVIELRDVPSTGKQISELAHFAATSKNVARWSTYGASLVMIAQSYLMWKFGISPTLADSERWLNEYIVGKCCAEMGPGAQQLKVGDTIRCAYGVDYAVNQYTDPENGKSWVSVVEANLGGGTSGTIDPLNGLSLPAGTDPYQMTLPTWKHEGVMFGRALRPGTENLPDWFWDLYPDAELGNEITELGPLRRAFACNPPLSTLWQTTGWTWLLNWVLTVDKTIERLERKITSIHVRCGFERLWVCDVWKARPSWPKPNLSVTPAIKIDTNVDVAIMPYIPPYHTEQVGWWVRVSKTPVCTYRMESRWRLKSTSVSPRGGAEFIDVDRHEIPKPLIPRVTFQATVGATKTLILGALSISRASGAVKRLLKKPKMTNK